MLMIHFKHWLIDSDHKYIHTNEQYRREGGGCRQGEFLEHESQKGPAKSFAPVPLLLHRDPLFIAPVNEYLLTYTRH